MQHFLCIHKQHAACLAGQTIELMAVGIDQMNRVLERSCCKSALSSSVNGNMYRSRTATCSDQFD